MVEWADTYRLGRYAKRCEGSSPSGPTKLREDYKLKLKIRMDILQKSVTSSSLQKKTSSILDVFTKTITSLQDVITNAKDQVKVKEEEIKSA